VVRELRLTTFTPNPEMKLPASGAVSATTDQGALRMTTQLEQAWEIAKQRYAAVGVDVEEALRQLDRLPVSMHCWQGDDVAGFENPEGSLTGGIQATGNYPGKARNARTARRPGAGAEPDPGAKTPEPARDLSRIRRLRAKSSLSTLKTGLSGRKPTNWGWISTRPASRTR
jgi:L-rhamnose isomerase